MVTYISVCDGGKDDRGDEEYCEDEDRMKTHFLV